MFDLNEIVFSLTRAVDGINPKFDFHSRMVTYTALTINKRLGDNGLNPQDVLLASLLHDIGVVRLRQREVTCFLEDIPKNYFNHETLGSDLLKKYKFFASLSKAIYYHHLNYEKIKNIEDEVPLLSQIIHISDRIAVTFVTNCNSYYDIKNAKKYVIEFLSAKKGINFNPEIVDLFLDNMRNYEEFWLNLFFIRDLNFKNLVKDFFISPFYLDEDDLKEIVPFFGEIIDSHSSFTKCHSIFVANLSYLIGDNLLLSEREKNLLYLSGYLHDLGKIYVPVDILEKPGPLDKGEREIVSLHPYFTRKILSDITDFDEVADIASNHHERLDGSGYPRALKSEEISLSSKILMICDIMASFLEDRPYRSAYGFIDTLGILKDWANSGKIDLNLVDKIYTIRQDLENYLQLSL